MKKEKMRENYQMSKWGKIIDGQIWSVFHLSFILTRVRGMSYHLEVFTTHAGDII